MAGPPRTGCPPRNRSSSMSDVSLSTISCCLASYARRSAPGRLFAGLTISISVTKSAGARPRVVTTIKAGLVIQPGERVRIVSGSSGKKSHGEAPPEEGARNFFLFLKAGYLDRSGLLVRLSNRQVEVCRATFKKE